MPDSIRLDWQTLAMDSVAFPSTLCGRPNGASRQQGAGHCPGLAQRADD